MLVAMTTRERREHRAVQFRVHADARESGGEGTHGSRTLMLARALTNSQNGVIPSAVEGPLRNRMTYYVYMLANRSRVVLYIGVTNSLQGRLWWHWNTEKNSFVKKYKLDRLVYYEQYEDVRDAIAREKQLKHWSRQKKNDLVRQLNPKWEDLGVRMFGAPMRGPSTSLGMTH